MIIIRRANGDGTIVKLTGNRRKPYACRKIIGWKEDGKPILKYISYHRTKREAERALAEFNADPYKLSGQTLEEVYKEWIALQSGRADSTLKGYGVAWKKLAPIHDARISSLDRFELQKYFDNADMTEDSIQRVKNLLRKVFEHAVKHGYLPISALNIHKAIDYRSTLKTSERKGSAFTKEELQYLWNHKDNDIIRIILVYTYTGARFAELHNLRPEDCHDDYLDIVQSKTESGVRQIPLSDKVKSLLPIATIPPHTTFWMAFKMILPNHKPHDTRHTFVSLMTEAGVDKRILRAIVGHKPKDVTDEYTHISLETMLEAVNKI